MTKKTGLETIEGMVKTELRKINLDTVDVEQNAALNKEQLPQKHMKHKRKGKKIFLILLSIFLILLISVGGAAAFLYVTVGETVKTLYAQGMKIQGTGQELSAAVKSQDLETSKTKLADVKNQLTELHTTYKKLSWLATVPKVKEYISDGEHVFNAGFAGIAAGEKAIAALEPNADLLGIKGGKKTSFLSGSADDRIQFAIKTMTALIPQINGMAQDVDTVRKELASIDPNRYPEEFQGKKIRGPLIAGKETIDSAANLFVNAQPLLTNLPAIMGEPVERRYLVLFQNDKELRPTGGFLTAYAQFRLSHGKAILEKSDDIYTLDASLRKKYPAPKEILTYHINVNNLNIRDSNLSPDYALSMKQFEEMYANASGAEKIDGIIAMDTHAMVEALKILGPLYVYGREFSAVNDPRCDCPKAVYELEDYSSRPVNYVRTDRKGVIGTLMQLMLQMALGTSPSKYWGQLFQMSLDQINQKHIFAYFHDEAAQKAVENFNMAGRIMTAEETASILAYKEGNGWDYLHVNQANMAGQKANMFVTQKYTKDTTVNSDGTITTVLTVDYKNPFPGSDCNLEHGQLCLNAPLRNWVRVYVPKGSTLTSSKGTQSPKSGGAQEMSTSESLGKTVFEGFIVVNPLGVAQLQLTYTSPVKSTDGKYRVLIQKQGGTADEEFTLKVNGQNKKFILNNDTELVM